MPVEMAKEQMLFIGGNNSLGVLLAIKHQNFVEKEYTFKDLHPLKQGKKSKGEKSQHVIK